jgi:hypothetical protein
MLTKRHPSNHKSWHKISPASGGLSVGIVRLRTEGHGLCFCIYILYNFTKLKRAHEKKKVTKCCIAFDCDGLL